MNTHILYSQARFSIDKYFATFVVCVCFFCFCSSLYAHMHVHSQRLSCVCLFCDSMDCSPPGSSVRAIFSGKNTGVGYHFLPQGIFPTQGSNVCLLHCRWILYCWAIREALHMCIHIHVFCVNYLKINCRQHIILPLYPSAFIS